MSNPLKPPVQSGEEGLATILESLVRELRSGKKLVPQDDWIQWIVNSETSKLERVKMDIWFKKEDGQ